MLIKKPEKIKSSEITPEKLYVTRRDFLEGASRLGLVSSLGTTALGNLLAFDQAKAAIAVSDVSKSNYSTDETLTDFEDATTYNNFYEFGTSKDDPHQNSGRFKPLPWKIEVTGECEKPGEYELEDFIKPFQLEERIYRLRCVEAWSMVIPWIGVPLADILKKFEPNSDAHYVALTTVRRPREMPGLRYPSLKWPYIEGLRIDEAMHPLTIMAVGMYGQTLPNQNGAPFRLVVPWKYGFKSIKSIVKINFTKRKPKTSWNIAAPGEYGFYSNVNPEVDHPRWSQRKERRIGEFLRKETLMFNGYAEEVAHLYAGMDLHKNF